MSRYKISGGHKLQGTVNVHGAKNAALPILAATVINSGKSVIHNCPDLSDIKSTIEILEILGCRVTVSGSCVTVDSSTLSLCDIPSCVMSKTRSSTVFAGALAARCKKAYIEGSGGCKIGSRPIDIHLDGFKSLGMEITEKGDAVTLTAKKITPCRVFLKFPSVGATENIMLASSLTPGKTTICNAAMEPEIVNLAEYLKSIGVKVKGEGTNIVTIDGTCNPTNGEVTIIPDRIVASTYMMASLITKGDVTVNNVNISHISPIAALLRRMGASLDIEKNSVRVKYINELCNMPYVATAPYPGFPTDAQPLLVSLMSVSKGMGVVKESIFENRFLHCPLLNSMGADIELKGRYAFIKGVDSLKGTSLEATDLRCGAALCLASLACNGEAVISGTQFIERGYEDLCFSLNSIGAKTERVE